MGFYIALARKQKKGKLRAMPHPIAQFEDWFGQAQRNSAIADATAMTLATVDADNRPSARIVLMKSFSEAGITFYTNTHSRKGRALAAHPYAALVFYWMPLDKQVRIEGSITPVSDAEADAYFASRERLKQAGAWASLQSQVLDTRETLIARTEAVEKEYAGRDIPRPPHWSGYVLTPDRFEFWQQLEGRLHDRHGYRLRADGGWDHDLLYP